MRDNMIMKKAFIIIIITMFFFFIFYNFSAILQTRKNVPAPVEKIKEPQRDKNSIENKLKYLMREKQKKTIIRPVCQDNFYLSCKYLCFMI
jgi:cell division protein FtsL